MVRFSCIPLRSIFVIALMLSQLQFSPVARAEEGAEAAAEAPKAEAEEPAKEATEKQAETAPAAPAEAAKPAPQIKPWSLSVDPVFKGPLIKKFATPSDLTGRDRQILENLDYKPTGTKMRLDQIRKLTGDLKKAPIRSEAALNASLSMLRLYEEQGMVFEWMRVVGIADPKYPDLGATLKNIRRQQAQRYQELILNYPKNPNIKQWKFKLTVARLKLGDPSVRDEAVAMLKTLQGAEQHELAAVGVTQDAAAGRLPSPFGNIEQIMQSSTDQYEGAAFKLILAEQEIAKNKIPSAVALLQDVIATSKNIRKGDKEQTPGTILQAAAAMLIEAALKTGTGVNQEVYQTLVNNDLVEYARSYLEEVALKIYPKNLASALKAYGDALSAGQSNDALKIRVETRMLDLTIASNDPRMILIAWERVVSRGIQKTTSLDSQMLQSMNIVMSQFKMKPDKDLALRIVAMHDSFVRGFEAYATREDYELRMIDILAQTQQYSEVGKRSERAAVKFKDKMNRIAALQHNLKARQQLMGLGPVIKIASGQKIVGEPAMAAGYIANADKLRQLLSKFEGDDLQYTAAFVQLLTSTSKQVPLARFEEAFTRAPRNALAADSASVLLEYLIQKKELLDAEKFIRIMMKNSIVPSKDPYRSLAKVLENVVFEHAKQLFESKQYDQAGMRFAAFQKEFPGSANSPVALERSGAAFGLANKIDFSMSAYDLYLKLYPKNPQSKEIRWSAAELARNSKSWQKAAEHYQFYAQLHPEDGLTRKVSLRAAECFRDAGKIPEAISEYERYLKVVKTPAEQRVTLEAIAGLAQKANNGVIALSALERLSKIVTVSDDVINVNFNLLMVYQKLGRDEQAKKAAGLAVSTRPATADGFKIQAKAKYAFAKFEVNGLRTRQVMNQKDLKVALQNLVKDYERLKSNLLAPCEIPGVDWCSLGYFEVSKLSSDLGKLLAVVEPSNDLDEQVVSELKSMILFNRDKFKSEARSFALQAEDALNSSGGPDQESIEKMKVYIQQIKQSRDDEGSAAGGGGGGGMSEGEF
ncbi:MAG: tetratricopeptide repeat protein [Silvanigrellaceae bacterium]